MLRRTFASWGARFSRRFMVPLTLVALVSGFSPLLSTAPAQAGTMQNYVVLYSASAVPADAAASIAKAGGTLVYSYDQIGVAIARSDNASFRDNIVKDGRVDGASVTAPFATKLDDGQVTKNDASGPQQGDLPNAPATDADTLSPLQWDMRQIHTPEAHAITGGSPAVLVGDIDTGIDFNHPDLRQNIDVADSVNCTSGAPVAGLAAQDDNGHGTHTAGTIAAASNGFGIVGVAPNVRIAAIKSGDAAGFFFPESVICGFVWAGTHHVDVTNNSYFADPFLFNCRNDPVQRAVWKSEQRAIRFAMNQGTTVVAAEGNESEDLSHPAFDATSPDNTTPVLRAVTNACVVIPVEISGVIGVSADGNARQTDASGNPQPGYLKSFYSNVGVSTVDVVAPGGDSVFGRTPEAVNGRVLSTWPPNIPCTRSVKETMSDPSEPTVVYCYLQGTSMASPHVAGVAALIVSRFGNLNNPQNGLMRPGAVEAYISQTADPQPCPTFLPPTYESFFGVGTESNAFFACQGGTGHNSWYGNGQVNAFNAVTHTSGS
jgi:subtilisin family serine protease